MKQILIILASLFFAYTMAFAQDDIYFTWNAKLQLNGAFEGEAIYLETQDVSIKLDYETTEMIIRFPLSSLKSNIDTVNQVLKNKLSDVVFDGELSLEYINTESHPPQSFTVEGWLILGTSKFRIKGKGEIHHINDTGEFACMLGMTVHLNLKELKVDYPWPGLENEFEAIITQAILKKNKQ